MVDKRIFIMCGLPRSGKSTWIQDNIVDGQVVVSADNLRYLVYNQRFWAEGEPLMWSIRTILLKSLMQQGTDIVIDETNTTKFARKSIIKLAKEYGYTIIGLIVEDETHYICIERAKKTGRLDLIPIIEKMQEQFEIPTLEEGFDILNMI